jgi:hypothetical protein
MRIGYRKIGVIYFGRPDYRRDAFEVGVNCWPVEVPDGEIPWRYSQAWVFRLPRLIYRVHHDISVKWTGRDVTVAGIICFGHVWMWG